MEASAQVAEGAGGGGGGVGGGVGVGESDPHARVRKRRPTAVISQQMQVSQLNEDGTLKTDLEEQLSQMKTTRTMLAPRLNFVSEFLEDAEVR